MSTTLKQTYLSLLSKYSSNQILIQELWEEVESSYSSIERCYHTLIHLENILEQLIEVKDQINNWDAVLFTLFYHDIVYDALKGDNEERSANIALKQMSRVGIKEEICEIVTKQIIATKSHVLTEDRDTNYFLDADLSILGQSFDLYIAYFKEVRKEYSIYPDDVYNPGRLKVLKHIILMDKIFKTEYFYNKLEVQARANIIKELELLS
ncbi:HD domain-containing protein [Myroides profundi]|uniref:Predicted metal-dependent phosphohydrolase, HD superfamily n=1 Tax=Myroides profundi TaxID=480520 RepID=A0AAJ5BD04_MYRPR|nr:hypothetical protein [Myroides profundi]AJH14939.1 hypothetical protein MPR_1759 [Myroides profundi]SEQ29133.1 Predicted metal-dependent phosphohydrolase, HD superfamily [Myroides profundi]